MNLSEVLPCVISRPLPPIFTPIMNTAIFFHRVVYMAPAPHLFPLETLTPGGYAGVPSDREEEQVRRWLILQPTLGRGMREQLAEPQEPERGRQPMNDLL